MIQDGADISVDDVIYVWDCQAMESDVESCQLGDEACSGDQQHAIDVPMDGWGAERSVGGIVAMAKVDVERSQVLPDKLLVERIIQVVGIEGERCRCCESEEEDELLEEMHDE